MTVRSHERGVDGGDARSTPDDNFSTLFDFLPIGAYRSSPEGRQLRANPALVRLNGYASEAEMLAAVNDIGREWYVDVQQRTRFAALLERDGHVVNFVSEIYRHKTRERIWIREAAHVVRDRTGRVRFYEGTVEDITEQRLTQLALEVSERRFKALTERAQGLTVVCDEGGVVSYASPASHRLLGRAPEALTGRNIFDLIHPDDRASARAEFTRVLVFESSGVECTVRYAYADGGWRHFACLANNCLGDPAVDGVVLNYRDVTDRLDAEAALRRLADHDELTGLANRRHLLERVNQAMVESVTRSRCLNGLLFLDLDHFKEVNDCHGHRAGDLLLQAVAQRLRGCVRAVDTVARFGGDEFVVLLKDLGSDREDACLRLHAVGSKTLARLNLDYPLEAHALRVGCSIGATTFGGRPEAVEDVVKRADEALYLAKKQGRNLLRIAAP